jgi:hypothetical protein
VELANPTSQFAYKRVKYRSTELKYKSTEYNMANKFNELFIKDLKKYV